MTPEAGDYLEKARHALNEAKAVKAIDLTEATGRAAYLAAYHAAQALIFQRIGIIAKTHSGVRAEFARLAKDDPTIGREFVTLILRELIPSSKSLITKWGRALLFRANALPPRANPPSVSSNASASCLASPV